MNANSCILWSAIFLNLTQNFLKLRHITLKKRKNQFLCFLLKFLLSVFKRTIHFLTIVLEKKSDHIHIFKRGWERPQLLKIWLFHNLKNALGSSPAALPLPHIKIHWEFSLEKYPLFFHFVKSYDDFVNIYWR